MRIVADTNTVLSGLLWQGPAPRLLELAREGKVSLGTTLMLPTELAEIMVRLGKRPIASSKLRISPG